MTRNQRVPVTEAGLAHIIANLRPRDRAEIFALRWDDDERALLDETLPWCGDMCWIWERDHVPVAAQGAMPVRPGVWAVWAFGTESWPSVILDMTRHAKRFIIPAVLRSGAHRAECRALSSHGDSRRWIEALGGRLECILEGFGRDAEDFAFYTWRAKDYV